MLRIAVILLVLVLTQLPGNAHAGIAGTTGAVTVLRSAPPSVGSGQLESSTTAYVFLERENVVLAAPLAIDGPGAAPAPIPAGTEVTSHLIHFDKVGSSVFGVQVTGTVTFDSDILGVILLTPQLDASDPILGSSSTFYPCCETARRTGDENDVFAVVGTTVSFTLRTTTYLDHIRVVTRGGTIASPIPITASAGGPYSVQEGRSVVLTGSTNDPSGTFAWDLNNDGSFETASQKIKTLFTNVTLSADGLDGPGTQTVVLRACGGDNACATSSATVNIINQAPQVELNGPVSANKGDTKTYTFEVTDPGQDSFVLKAGFPKCGGLDGIDTEIVALSLTSTGGTFQCKFLTETPFRTFRTVAVQVTDSDGADSSIASIRVRVVAAANTPPSANAGGPYSVPEGGSVQLSGSGSDPDGGPLTFAWDLDNNGTFETSGQSVAFSAAGRDGPDTQAVVLRVCDPVSACGTSNATVNIMNVSPTATLVNDGPVNEGSAATVSFANQHDPSSADSAAGFRYAYSCANADLSGTTYGNSGHNASTSCTFGDNGAYPVKGRIIDKDGGFTEYVTHATVNNVNPSVTLDTTASIAFPAGTAFVGTKGVAQTHKASASDPGSDDLTFKWAFPPDATTASATYFNDGVGPDPFPSPLGAFPFASSDTASVTFGSPGLYHVLLEAVDDDSGATSTSVPKVVVDDCDCTKTVGFWRHSFRTRGKHQIDDVTLQAYLGIVNFVSGVFSERVPASTIAEARQAFAPGGNDDGDGPSNMRGKATQRALAAWLNFAYGAVGWDEGIAVRLSGGDDDDDDEPPVTKTFGEWMTEVEAVLLNPNASHSDLVRASAIANAINELDEDDRACKDGGDG